MNKIHKLNLVFWSIMLSLIIVSCKGNRNEAAENVQNEEVAASSIHITKEQFEAEKMKIGQVQLQDFQQSISCNGYIMAPTNGMVQLSTLVPGMVENIHCIQGQYVKKGTVLCTLISNELINLQQEYVETGAELSLLQNEYERKKALYDENISAEKEFIMAENAYTVMQAKYKALQIRLSLLGLNVDKIKENGFYAQYSIIAPISGYITDLQLVMGQFVESQVKLMEIVDISQLQLQLHVFEDDAIHLKEGQPVRFSIMGDEGKTHTARLVSVGKSIDPVSRTILCIAEIDQKDSGKYANRSYVQARVVLTQKALMALPNSAILSSHNADYVFVAKPENGGYTLEKIPVKTGIKSDEFTEVKWENPDDNIVVDGLYNLQVE